MQTRAEERSQGTIQKGAPKGRFDDIYITKKISFFFKMNRKGMRESILRACLHGGGGPQEGEVTRLGGVTRLSIQSLILM